MAPGYRPGGQSRRNNNRGYVDHDVFEGLPLTHWRRGTIQITQKPPPALDANLKPRTGWDPEYPRSMPKDYHLLPQHSQDLLRAARSGQLYKRRAPVEDEDCEVEVPTTEKPEKREVDPVDEGFTTIGWKPVPKHLEGPEFDYLAKRRKGLRGSVIKPGVVTGPTMTKATVRRTDAEGNSYVEDVVVAEGQALEGEVISQTTIIDPTAAAIGNNLAAQPTPPKRRAPPPKRKSKLKGRKKKLPLPVSSVPGEPSAVSTGGQGQQNGDQAGHVGLDGVKLESDVTAADRNEDTEMGDGSILPSDEEGDDGDDGEDGEEGDEGEDDVSDDGQDHEPGTEYSSADKTQKATGESRSVDGTVESGKATTLREHSNSRDIPIANIGNGPGHSLSPGLGGSPLKKVVTPPKFVEISPNQPETGDGDAEAEGEDDDHEIHMNEGPDLSLHEYGHHEPTTFPDGEEQIHPAYHHLPEYLENNEDAVFQAMDPTSEEHLQLHDLESHDMMLLDDGDEMLLDGDGFSGALRSIGDTPHPDEPIYDHDPQAIALEVSGLPEEDDGDNFGDLLAGLDDHLNSIDRLNDVVHAAPERVLNIESAVIEPVVSHLETIKHAVEEEPVVEPSAPTIPVEILNEEEMVLEETAVEEPLVKESLVEEQEVEVPEVEAPIVETLEVEAPVVEAPEAEAPEVEAPETKTPEITAPIPEAPQPTPPLLEAIKKAEPVPETKEVKSPILATSTEEEPKNSDAPLPNEAEETS